MGEIKTDLLMIDANSDVHKKVLRAKRVTNLRLKDGKDNRLSAGNLLEIQNDFRGPT